LTSSKPTAYIFDVDGTLANVEPYRHHVTGENRNFEAFHAESIDALPHSHVVNMAREALLEGHDILVVTARMEKWRQQTSMWIAIHDIPADALFMRANYDNRKDYLVKKDILDMIQERWTVVHAVDDNPEVIALWKENGIPTTIIDGWIDK
jgi:phosphoglycolate phosphatase-like HAD superfamily hydrolase